MHRLCYISHLLQLVSKHFCHQILERSSVSKKSDISDGGNRKNPSQNIQRLRPDRGSISTIRNTLFLRKSLHHPLHHGLRQFLVSLKQHVASLLIQLCEFRIHGLRIPVVSELPVYFVIEKNISRGFFQRRNTNPRIL